MTTFLYGIIIAAATFLGAYVGLGGGVIIKPLLDLLGRDTVQVVNFLSTCAVFSMSISSTVDHIRSKTKINFKIILALSLGAITGGIFGSKFFNYLLTLFDNDALTSIQGLILGCLLVASVIYVNKPNAKSFKLKNPVLIALGGLFLGFISSFLGVGGGPINVAFFILLFSMTVKEAAVYSVGTIFFSQLAKIITLKITDTVPDFDIITLVVAVVCAVAGGIVGANMNKKGNEKVIKTVFTAVVAAIAIVNFYNAAAVFFT